MTIHKQLYELGFEVISRPHWIKEDGYSNGILIVSIGKRDDGLTSFSVEVAKTGREVFYDTHPAVLIDFLKQYPNEQA